MTADAIGAIDGCNTLADKKTKSFQSEYYTF